MGLRSGIGMSSSDHDNAKADDPDTEPAQGETLSPKTTTPKMATTA